MTMGRGSCSLKFSGGGNVRNNNVSSGPWGKWGFLQPKWQLSAITYYLRSAQRRKAAPPPTPTPPAGQPRPKGVWLQPQERSARPVRTSALLHGECGQYQEICLQRNKILGNLNTSTEV